MASQGVLLVVDDEAEIREIIAMNAAPLGLDVLEAGDGHQALEILKEHHVDVVISDLMMPRVSGLTLLMRLREEQWAKPFIFVTAYPSQDSTLQALRLGAFDYLEKPFEMDEMKALIAEAFRVSRELGRIEGNGARQSKTAIGKKAAQEDATHEIQRLGSLRVGGDQGDVLSAHEEDGAADGKQSSIGGADDKAKLIELFVAEASPQLLFCDGSIRALLQAEERAFELGYLFRVAQTLAIAAGAIEAKRMARLARAAEQFYTALRVKPRSVTADVAGLAQRTNDRLRAEVDRLTVETAAAEGDEGLERLVEEIMRATAGLEPGKLKKAS